MTWIGELVPLAPFVLAIVFIWGVARAKKVEADRRADLQKQLLAKCSTVEELTDLLNTPGGKLFMPEPRKVRTMANRVGTSVFVIVVGIGLLVSSVMFSANNDEHHSIAAGGILAIAAGIGLLISALLSEYLSRNWKSQDKSSS